MYLYIIKHKALVLFFLFKFFIFKHTQKKKAGGIMGETRVRIKQMTQRYEI